MYKIRFFLRPKTSVNIYNMPKGVNFRGYLMEWLKDISPEELHHLHENDQVRPYAMNLHQKKPLMEWTIITFENALGKLLVNEVLENRHHVFKISGHIFTMENIAHGSIDLREIFNHAVPIKKFTIYFPKPTYFNTSRGNYPVRLPIPEVLFSNLCTLWNRLSNGHQDIEEKAFIDWVNTHLYLTGHEIKTIPAPIGKSVSAVGFRGHTSYCIQDMNLTHYETMSVREAKEDFYSKAIWTDFLCKMGQYTNVGVNRTASFGVMNYYRSETFKQ